MINLAKIEAVQGVVQDSLNNIVDTVEQLNQTVFDLPLDLLKTAGVPETITEPVKEKEHQMVGSLCSAVRATTDQLGHLATELLTGIEEGRKKLEQCEPQA